VLTAISMPWWFEHTKRALLVTKAFGVASIEPSMMRAAFEKTPSGS